MRYEYRCSSINLENRTVSLATISKRVNLNFVIPEYYEKFISWNFKSFELVYFRKHFFIHFVMEKSISSDLLNSPYSGLFVGIDRDIFHIAVKSENQFYNGSRLREIKNRYFPLKRILQKKGTRSTKFKLKRVAVKEQRFQKDVNHCLTKDIISKIPKNSTIILEDLSYIRKSAKIRKRTRLSRQIHCWSFFQLQLFLDYKAREKNIEIIYIDPRYTSQQCSSCSFIARNNRSGSHFAWK